MGSDIASPQPDIEKQHQNEPDSQAERRLLYSVYLMLVMTIEVRGYSHSELAIKAKLKSPATISNLTSGYRRTCAADTAKRLARALKVDGSKLFEVVS